MAISTKKLAAIGGVLFISVVISAALLYSSIVPQFSVYEFYTKQDPSTLMNKKIQLVGDVQNWNTSDSFFQIRSWENNNLTVSVTYTQISEGLPSGFTNNTRVMVEGMLTSVNTHFLLKADLVSTKCPSKYQSS